VTTTSNRWLDCPHGIGLSQSDELDLEERGMRNVEPLRGQECFEGNPWGPKGSLQTTLPSPPPPGFATFLDDEGDK
jgi:hypothetical protein